MSINHSLIADLNHSVRPTHIEVNLAVIEENFRAIRSANPKTKQLVVLKANAYGHGMLPVAEFLETLGVDYFGVAVLEEGIKLRQTGITTPILVMGGILGNQIPDFIENDLTLTASSISKLQQIDNTAEKLGIKAKVHLKIDTGMERIGVHYYSAQPLLRASINCKHTQIEGIYTHFANADAQDEADTLRQLDRFNTVCSFYHDNNLPIPLRHAANSAAFLRMPSSHLDMIRTGKLLYGIYPDDTVTRGVLVKPALCWKSRVVYFKVVKPNHPVSYGSTWQSDKNTRMVTVPVGFGDGYFRCMSGKARVIIRGKKYPVRGRICMDQIMVEIADDTAYNDDEVTLLGCSGETEIRVEDLAQWADTIPSEILTHINTRVPRVHIYRK